MRRFIDGVRLSLGLAVAALVLPACGSSSSSSAAALPGVLQFLSATIQVDEDDVAGIVTLTVTRTGGSSGAVSVDWATTVGSAGAADFTGASSTLTWAAGETADKSFTVNIATDALVEGSEFFSATLSNASGGATLGAITTAAVEILDVLDSPVSGVLQFSAATFPTAEGVVAIVTVLRTGGTTDDITVDVDLDGGGGTAASPADYTDPGFPVTLSWAAGNNSPQTFNISIADDGVDGAAVETILLTLLNPTSSGTLPALGTTQTAAVEITDGDAVGVMAFTTNAFSIAEDGTTGILTVTRSAGTLGAASVEVSVAVGGTAVGGGVDYSFTSPVLVSWAAGEGGPKDVNVSIVDDLTSDGDLTVFFELAAPLGATLGGVTTATLTIVDDEVPPSAGEITFTATGYSVNEGDGTITLMVTRQNGTAGAVDVTVTTSILTATSATNPAAKQDFVAVNQVLSWANGVGGAQPVVITIINNDGTAGQTGDTFGGSETFRVNLSVTLGTATIVGTNPEDVTIIDD